MPSRTEILSKLRQAEPALAARDLVPALSCFAFDGKNVTAYNEILAIRVPCPTPGFVGGIPGATLLKFLAACGSKEVTITKKDQEEVVQVVCGKAKMDVAWLQPEHFAFERPNEKGAVAVPVDEAFLLAMKKAMVSMGMDALRSWMLGVSVRVSGRKALFFSSNDFSITRAEATLPSKVAEQRELILVPSFCELLLSYASKDGLKAMAIQNGWLVCTFESGVVLYTREPEDVDVSKFEEAFNQNNVEAELLPIPKTLPRCLERAQILLDVKHDWSSFSVKDGRLKIRTEAPNSPARIVDVVALEGHADVELATGPAVVAKVLEHATSIALSDSCVVVEGEGFRSIVAVH